MAIALAESGVIDWADMQAALIATIEKESSSDGSYAYYTYFTHALTQVLRAREILHEDQIDALITTLAARPADHDHPHAHPH